MMDFEQAGYALDELIDELPEGIFKDLNGGVNLIEDEKQSEDGRYTLGTYFVNGMGRYVEIYYGSFVALYGEMDDELFTKRLKKTLHHELTHHVENMAGDRSLERWDERQGQLYGFGGIDVHSILFVDDDDCALAPAASAFFEENKLEVLHDVSSSSAGITAGDRLNPKAIKAGAPENISKHTPTAVTRDLIESHDVVLCMNFRQVDELSRLYQELDERIMCLAEYDIAPPTLPFGWKKCMNTLLDEVLAVIDELIQEREDGV